MRQGNQLPRSLRRLDASEPGRGEDVPLGSVAPLDGGSSVRRHANHRARSRSPLRLGLAAHINHTSPAARVDVAQPFIRHVTNRSAGGAVMLTER